MGIAEGRKGADRLRLKSHVHKLALITFMRAVNNFVVEALEKSPIHDIKLSLEKATRHVSLSFCVRGIEGYRLNPEPPLHFSEEQAHLREKLLYAPSEGMYTHSGDIEKVHAETRRKVFRNLTLFLLVDQHTERQGFVQQCLNAFLEMVTTNKKVAAAADAEERAGNARLPDPDVQSS